MKCGRESTCKRKSPYCKLTCQHYIGRISAITPVRDGAKSYFISKGSMCQKLIMKREGRI